MSLPAVSKHLRVLENAADRRNAMAALLSCNLEAKRCGESSRRSPTHANVSTPPAATSNAVARDRLRSGRPGQMRQDAAPGRVGQGRERAIQHPW